MKLKNVAAVGALAVATAIALSACSGGGDGTGSPAKTASPDSASSSIDFSSLHGTITSGGSSAQANAEAAWTAAFTAQAGGVTINYDKSQGSGGGVQNWLNGSYDFAGSDAPLTAQQQTQSQQTCGKAGAIDLPAYLSGVTLIYNLPGVDSLNLDSKVIAEIFTHKITNWNDPAIAALNSGATLPNQPITTVVRADGSGTTDNFTNYLSQTQPSIWTYPASTAYPSIGGSGTSAQQGGTGVVNAVEAGTGTIGYADQSSIGKAKTAKIQVQGTNTFVAYSAKGATNALDTASTSVPSNKGDLTQKIDYVKITSTSAYPIPLLSYQILCKQFTSATQAKLTRAYVGFVASAEGQAVAAKNAGSAPLPAKLLADIQNSLKLVK